MLTTAFLIGIAPTPQLALKPNMVLSRSVVVKKGAYNLPNASEDGTGAAIVVRGNGITVDFNGATLWGTPPTTEPDRRKGTAVRIEGSNVTIKNLKVRGYKVGLFAQGVRGFKLVNSDFSYNWKQRLLSTPERENEADWMSYHQNEKNEWLRFGAGVYLRDCDKFELKGVRVNGGQCGVMLTNSNGGLLWNSDLSFNSAIGIGMYRSSNNRIMHNKVDWCVRGFSYGVYNRGQDSAGILVYNQSSKNVFAYNSATHGGDGFFLWAGQTTMDTGQGGANDNLLYGNDFSHAPANGIEATFSRNIFVNNLLLESWHGIWGGYSYDSKVIANVFGYNTQAIAWEHGQNNEIALNTFYRDNEAIAIWSNPTQDPNWGYAKYRDTRSRDWVIKENVFQQTFANVFRLSRSQSIRIENNFISNAGSVFPPADPSAPVTGLTVRDNEAHLQASEPLLSGNTLVVGPQFKPLPQASSLAQGRVESSEQYLSRFPKIPDRGDRQEIVPVEVSWSPWPGDLTQGGSEALETPFSNKRYFAARSYAPQPLPGGQNPFLRPGQPRGWRYIIVDEWGPYDFKRPLLVQREELNPGVVGKTTRKRFEILGPSGKWRVVSTKGVARLSARSGVTPQTIDVELPRDAVGLREVVMEYVGGATTDYRGIVTPAGKPVRFGFSRFNAPIAWDVKFYKWSESENPSDPRSAPKDFASVLRTAPIKLLKTDRLDLAGGALVSGLPADHYATLAEGSFEVPKGDYAFEVLTDDGCRVWVDGKLVIGDAWKYQGPTLYTTKLSLGGKHAIRVEHFQIDGYAALKVNLRPAKP